MKLPRQRKVKNPIACWRFPCLHFSKPLLFSHTTAMPQKSLQRQRATFLHNCLGYKCVPPRCCCFTVSEDTATADFLWCRKAKEMFQAWLHAPSSTELLIYVLAALNRQMHFFLDPFNEELQWGVSRDFSMSPGGPLSLFTDQAWVVGGVTCSAPGFPHEGTSRGF